MSCGIPRIGELVWLFYQDRFGWFKIIPAAVADYQYQGKYPIPIDGNNISQSFEEIIDDMNTGRWSKISDRNSTYLRCLGWSLGRNASSETGIQVNHAFGRQFHKFIQLAVLYYSEKQVAVAIRGAARVNAPPTVATEASIRDTLKKLKESYQAFEYGRNQYNTTRAIADVATIDSLIYRLRGSIGIPITPEFEERKNYAAAAYDILVLKTPISTSTVNRYMLHQDLSVNGMDMLNQLYDVNIESQATDATTGRTELSLWLDNIEPMVESYRTAYKMVTGVDLGKVTPELLRELKMRT